jgi:hypothetical protein
MLFIGDDLAEDHHDVELVDDEGSSASSATIRTATPTPRLARTTPAPHRSPEPPARRRSCWPLRPQPTPGRRCAAMGVLLPARITRSPRLLQPAPRPEHRPPSPAAAARQPPRRHPPRLPQEPHPLRRTHRLEPPPQQRRLTPVEPGMSAAIRAARRRRRQGDQATLHRAWMGSRSGDKLEIHPGQTVNSPPGDEHWHGVSSDSFMGHLAMIDNADDPAPQHDLAGARDRRGVRRLTSTTGPG